MASTTTISCDKLSRLVGTPKCPLVVDVRTEGDFAADPRLVPGAVRRDHATVAVWAGDLRAGRSSSSSATLVPSSAPAASARRRLTPPCLIDIKAPARRRCHITLIPQLRSPDRIGVGRACDRGGS
jgi:hypothetical protein